MYVAVMGLCIRLMIDLRACRRRSRSVASIGMLLSIPCIGVMLLMLLPLSRILMFDVEGVIADVENYSVDSWVKFDHSVASVDWSMLGNFRLGMGAEIVEWPTSPGTGLLYPVNVAVVMRSCV